MPTKRANSVNFGRAICEVLGINPDKVTSMSVFVAPRQLVSVSVDMFLEELSPDEMRMIADALRKDDKQVDVRTLPFVYSVIGEQESAEDTE